MRKNMGIIACLFAFAVPALAVQIGAARHEETTHVRTLAGPQSPPPTAPALTVAEPVTEPPTTEPAPPVLCPGAPHPEQACLGSHSHESSSPSAGTRQASSGTTASSGGGCSAPGPTPPDYIKQRESSGDYGLNDPNGHYGAWQFSPETWHSVGGSGTAADASPAEQDCRAAVLWDNGNGASNWAATL